MKRKDGAGKFAAPGSDQRRQQPETRAILFDLMGVLLRPSTDYVPDKLVEAVDDRVGRVTDDRHFKDEIQQEFHLTDPEFEDVMARIAGKYATFPPLWALLPELKVRYKLGVINNGTSLTFPWFNSRLGMDRNFDLYLSSGLAGVSKPAAGIYLEACRRLGVAPEECLFMDDLERNVHGAQEVGMQAIHWSGHAAGFRAFQDWLAGEAG